MISSFFFCSWINRHHSSWLLAYCPAIALKPVAAESDADLTCILFSKTAPPNFNFTSVCRTVRRGGGVAALFKDVYQSKQVSFGQYLSFEYLGIVLKGAPRILCIISYRPPKYSPAFEFTELLSMISSEFDCFAIAGVFNIHIDNAEIKTRK